MRRVKVHLLTVQQHMLRLRTPLSVHIPHGRQSRSDLALALAMHLVGGRTERRHHLLMRAHAEVSLPALLAQAAQLDGFGVWFSQALQPRRLRCYGSQFGLEHVELPAILLQARKHLPD